MPENWNFYQLLVEDKPASMMANLGVVGSAPVVSHPNFFFVSLGMLEPREDGLSSNAEFDQLCATEDRLIDAIKNGSTAIYVGRNTCNGTRDHYFYVADPAIVETLVSDVAPSLSPYQIECGGYEDAAWSVYQGFIYPGPNDLQQMQNRELCDQLAKRGDSLEHGRQVDHFAYFLREEARDTFRAMVVEDSFQIQDAHRTDDGEFALAFFREDCPVNLDDVTIDLRQKAAELGGHYDGWGCEVVTN